MVLRTKNATLVVIGDIGRSPRMCYHAKSLADKNYQVQIVGYLDSKPHTMISDHPNISFVPLYSVPNFINGIRAPYSMLFKFLWISIALFYTLLVRIKWPLLILMQNPPGVPAMVFCWLFSRLYRAQFVVDWHNYTYSMLCQSYSISEDDLQFGRCSEQHSSHSGLLSDDAAGSSGDAKRRRLTKQERSTQPAVHSTNKKRKSISDKKSGWLIQQFIKGTHYWEGFFGRRADLNLCVTRAMRQHLRDEWEVHSATVYDRPPAWKFKGLETEQRHQLFMRLAQLGGVFSAFAFDDEKAPSDTTEITRFSYRDEEGVAHLRPDRPLLLISSTSWTEDEDFGYLLDALREFDSVARLSSRANPVTRLPIIVCVITGKGPMKEYYLNRIEKAQMQNVAIITPWLEAEDYPLLLGSADIGVSLHTSTSGLDLPMKAVDMFGSGLPVIAKRFPCIGELVVEGQNGRLFDTSAELFNIIKSLACGFPTHSLQLKTLTVNVQTEHRISWDDNWDACVWPLIRVFGAPPLDELARRKRYAAPEGDIVVRNEHTSRRESESSDEEKAHESDSETQENEPNELDLDSSNNEQVQQDVCEVSSEASDRDRPKLIGGLETGAGDMATEDERFTTSRDQFL